MAFTITADLPLGTYRGAGADGQLEAVPSVSRLYSALLSAAGFGPRAVPGAGASLTPCEADEHALRWFEENPPDAVSVPAIQVNRGRATAYRDDGTIKKSKGSIKIKKLGKSADGSVAVSGQFAWSWREPPPASVMTALEALCGDVSHLGTTESPARVRVVSDAAIPATHVLDPSAGLFAGSDGHDVEVPLPGRLSELTRAHQNRQAVPSVAKDKVTADEVSRAEVPGRDAVALARYTPVGPEPTDVPWPQVLLLPARLRGREEAWGRGGPSVPETDRVRLAVNLHRALIKAIGEGAPPLVTGVYPELIGAPRRPANRLSIQVLDASMPVDLAGATTAFALLVPQGADPGDLEVMAGAVSSVTQVHAARQGVYELGPVQAVSGSTFWDPKPAGALRLWQTASPAVPDTRGARGTGWTFAHAALLSLGFVWRDQLPPVKGRGDQRQRAVVDAVGAAGVSVVLASPLRRADVRPYVHKVNDQAVVRPYRAQLWLGDLCPERAVQAIGQTRHLGGGLLVPLDVPEDEGGA